MKRDLKFIISFWFIEKGLKIMPKCKLKAELAKALVLFINDLD